MSSQRSLWPVDPQPKQARVWQSLTMKQQTRLVEVLARIFAQVISAQPAPPVREENKHES